MDLTIEVRTENGEIVLVLKGELDAYTAAKLQATAGAAVAPGDIVVCDVADLRFIDSTGGAVLLDTRRAAESGGGTFRLRNLTSRLARALDVMGVQAGLCERGVRGSVRPMTSVDGDGLVAVVAHSLLGNVTAIAGAVRTLLAHPDAPPMVQVELLQMIDRQANHVAEILLHLVRTGDPAVVEALDLLDRRVGS